MRGGGALTNGGPGRATEMPATFMYSYTFTRNQMAVGASSAVIMLAMIADETAPMAFLEIESAGTAFTAKAIWCQ